ncbi:hypothetical protein V865_002865 [Kwoniella europaea PYCC6329]|uniref:Cysteine-rich transmembrane CYSTM domain-containing protein n=1 Tax=Kwoniella europaea PYCC6329 TaxID=1423913 RepID=A0AAX4KFH6_9TREE
MGQHPADKASSSPVTDPTNPPNYSGPSNPGPPAAQTSAPSSEGNSRPVTNQPDGRPRRTFTNAPIVVDNTNLPNEGALYCSLCWGCCMINIPR